MTEAEWLASSDAQAMLSWLSRDTGPYGSYGDPECVKQEGWNRKLRLFLETGCEKCATLTHSMALLEAAFYVATADCRTLTEHAALLRDIFGSPFRSTWNNGTIPRMARQIYDSRDFSDMPILADALEEAGCTNEFILNHCRGLDLVPSEEMPGKYYYKKAGPHVRGCWVIDCLLGKS